MFIYIYICIDDPQFEILGVTSRLDNKKGDSTVFRERREVWEATLRVNPIALRIGPRHLSLKF